jgi:hypothetical protein
VIPLPVPLGELPSSDEKSRPVFTPYAQADRRKKEALAIAPEPLGPRRLARGDPNGKDFIMVPPRAGLTTRRPA